jgi:MOSC domain-containing protein YiiM
MRPGAFGENLTVEGTDEETTCLGDQWRVGDVTFEVTKPRTPCMTLARRHRRPDMVKVVFENGRSGWYLRVLAEGWIEAGAQAVLVDRPYPQWPVRRVADVMRERQDRPEEARLLGSVPALAEDWRVTLARES